MPSSKRFQQALSFATGLHAGQLRKAGQTPYVAHLLITAGTVLEYGGNENEAIAALLHDALEDQPHNGQTGAEIARQFGAEVLAIVEACSDTQIYPKPPWRERKEAFLKTIETLSPSACLVVAADKLHNIRSLVHQYRELGEDLWQNFKGGRSGTLWYNRAAFDALNRRGCLPPALLCELADAVSDLESIVKDETNLV